MKKWECPELKMATTKLYCCSDFHMVADAEDEVHRMNFSLV